MLAPKLIETIDQLRKHAEMFSQWTTAPDVSDIRRLVNTNTYWVETAHGFAPAKCVGFNAATSADYKRARAYGAFFKKGFGGDQAWHRVERLTSKEFVYSDLMEARFFHWVSKNLGPNVYDQTKKRRKFLSIVKSTEISQFARVVQRVRALTTRSSLTAHPAHPAHPARDVAVLPVKKIPSAQLGSPTLWRLPNGWRPVSRVEDRVVDSIPERLRSDSFS